MATLPLSELPLEILSNTAQLLAPPFYASKTGEDIQDGHFASLDPRPAPGRTTAHEISLVSKTCHSLLEASRPWLWEHVDVRSGRGWLAVVNALTEEVEDQAEGGDGADNDQSAQQPGSSARPSIVEGIPVPPSVAHARPPSMFAPFTSGYSPSAPPQYPSPYASSSAATHPIPGLYASNSFGSMFSYSPPQPERASLLVTPNQSRGPSPHPILKSPSPAPGPSAIRNSGDSPSRIDGLPTSSGAPSTIPAASSSKSILSNSASTLQNASAKLRGRSRSPRRSIGFATDGIDSILSRARSTSGQRDSRSASTSSWPRRASLERRRSSLSRSRIGDEMQDDADDEDEIMGPEEHDALDADRRRSFSNEGGVVRILTPPKSDFLELLDPDAEEEHWLNVNPELLPSPGAYIRHLSFVNFRTIGSRRTQDEAVRGRFVTAGRLEGVIKNAPNLVTVCMTEYVDSSLSYEVLDELFFRGSKRPRILRRPSTTARGASLSRIRSLSVDPSVASTSHDQLDPPRPVYAPYEDETEDQKWNRRSMFTPLVALDLTGCISLAFQEGMREFYEHYYAPDEGLTEEDELERGRGRSRRRGLGIGGPGGVSAGETETEDEGPGARKNGDRSSSRKRTPVFPHLQRLSLRACFGIDSTILDAILPSFPALTHLDLSNTKVSSRFLAALIEKCPRSLHLTSLSLARCPRLDPYVIVEFLCRSPTVADLRELNLFVNPTQGNPMRPDDLMRLITTAPCFKSGRLQYLDLSSAMFTPEHLSITNFPRQPALVSLGLSHIPLLPLPPITEFLLHQAPNVEILTLTGTAFETSLRPTNSALQINLELHARLINPLTTVPFSLASLNLTGSPALANPGPSRLRVIELSSPVRRAIGPEGGSHEWKIIKSKGGRGWYVDVSAGWIKGEPNPSSADPDKPEWKFARHLLSSHPLRKYLMGLSEAEGRVSSAIGWHSRKMEIIRGLGMLGREEGLAGAGAFAFEE